MRNHKTMNRSPLSAACCALFISAVLMPTGGVVASTQIPGPPQQRPVAIVDATIHPIDASVIERGSILFDQGRIVALGKEIEIPADAERIDGQDKHVYPGLFCAGGQLGLVEINSVRATRDGSEAGPVNPNVKAQVAVNPDSELIPVTRANGVLLTLTVPSGGLVSGMATVLQLDGWTWEDMTLKAAAAMHVEWPVMRSESASRPRRSESEPDAMPPIASNRSKIYSMRSSNIVVAGRMMRWTSAMRRCCPSPTAPFLCLSRPIHSHKSNRPWRSLRDANFDSSCSAGTMQNAVPRYCENTRCR